MSRKSSKLKNNHPWWNISCERINFLHPIHIQPKIDILSPVRRTDILKCKYAKCDISERNPDASPTRAYQRSADVSAKALRDKRGASWCRNVGGAGAGGRRSVSDDSLSGALGNPSLSDTLFPI